MSPYLKTLFFAFALASAAKVSHTPGYPCRPLADSHKELGKDLVKTFASVKPLYSRPVYAAVMDLSKTNEAVLDVSRIKVSPNPLQPDFEREVCVKRFRVHLKNPNLHQLVQEIVNEIEVWELGQKFQQKLLEYHQCYFHETEDNEIHYFVVLGSFRGPETWSPPRNRPFKEAPLQVRLKLYEIIATEILFLHSQGRFVNELPVDNIGTRVLTKEEAKAQAPEADLSVYKSLFWDRRYQLPFMTDFRKSTFGKAKFVPSSYPRCDHETASTHKGSIANDIWALGLLIAELELGPQIHLSPQKLKAGSKLPLFRSARKQIQMDLRDRTIRKAAFAIDGVRTGEPFSFGDLLISMLRVEQESRVKSMVAVAHWLQWLQELHDPKRTKEEIDNRVNAVRKNNVWVHLAERPNLDKYVDRAFKIMNENELII